MKKILLSFMVKILLSFMIWIGTITPIFVVMALSKEDNFWIGFMGGFISKMIFDFGIRYLGKLDF